MSARHWEETDGAWSREFSGTARHHDRGLDVIICGVQRADGSVERHANVFVDDSSPDYQSADLHAMAALLAAAADELDQLDGTEGGPANATSIRTEIAARLANASACCPIPSGRMYAEAGGQRVAIRVYSVDADHREVVRDFIAELHEVVRWLPNNIQQHQTGASSRPQARH